jgi:hypothetical protein
VHHDLLGPEARIPGRSAGAALNSNVPETMIAAMSEHIEVETHELQEQIGEAHAEQLKHGDGRDAGWVRYVGLSTAVFAAFAAVAALQSGNLINEAMIHQIQASDTWAEYQASRQKDHTYTIALNALIDAHAADPALKAALAGAAAAPGDTAAFASKTPAQRALEYRTKIAQETRKEGERSRQARALERASAEELARQRRFEFSVALIQVAIALGAVAALARLRPGWYLSLGAGAIGIGLFAMGFLGRY